MHKHGEGGPVSTQQMEASYKPRGATSEWNLPCQHLDLGLSSFWKCEWWTSIVFKPPRLWYFVMAGRAAEMTSGSILCLDTITWPWLNYLKSSLQSMWKVFNNQGKANGNHSRYHFTSVRMALIKKNTHNNCWRGRGENGPLIHCWQECKLVQPLGKTAGRLLKKC